MSLAIARNALRQSARQPLTNTNYYRPLVGTTCRTPSATACFISIVQPTTTRAFSTAWVHYQNTDTNRKADTIPASIKATTVDDQTIAAAAVNEKPTISSRIGKLYQTSKDLIKFYKDGLKLLWTNNKEAKALTLKVKNGEYVLNRSEFQLVHQSQKDMIKLIPFGLVFLILPESIPLLVIYAPSMVPGTCLKDSQIQKQREKLDKARQKMTVNVVRSAEQLGGQIVPEDFLNVTKFQKISKQFGFDFDLSRIDRRHLRSYCQFMGVNDYGTQFILQRRLSKYMNYIAQDDKLLAKENIEDLSEKELCHAVEERGMKSVNQDIENMKRGLKYWLTLTQDPNHTIPSGLLVFSRMFLLNANYKGNKQ